MNPLNKAHGLAMQCLSTETFNHSLRVAFAVAQSGSVPVIVAALLHDVAEDSGDCVTIETVHSVFGPVVSGIVRALTRKDGEEYRAYIERVREHGGEAVLVKRADLFDNLTGRECPPPASQHERYHIALQYLSCGNWRKARRLAGAS